MLTSSSSLPPLLSCRSTRFDDNADADFFAAHMCRNTYVEGLEKKGGPTKIGRFGGDSFFPFDSWFKRGDKAKRLMFNK